MKNFDEEREASAAATEDDRMFVLGGEHFQARPTVRPEALMRFELITEDSSVTETLEIVDWTILAMIKDAPDGGHQRYRDLRAREEDPIGTDDLLALAKWLVEVQTGRPTEPPQPSPDSPAAPTGTSLTDGSFSEETPPE